MLGDIHVNNGVNAPNINILTKSMPNETSGPSRDNLRWETYGGQF
jgi:hypothetical protein